MKSFIKTSLAGMGIFAQITCAFAQSASLLPNALQQYFDNNGNPLSLGTVTFYIPGTTVLKNVWQDGNEVTVWANPITLDAGGKPPGSAAGIYGSGTYRQIVKDRNGNTIWDAVTSSTGTGGSQAITGDGDAVGTIKPWAGIVAPNQYVFAYGQTISRTTYAALYSTMVQVQNVNCTSSSNTLSGIVDTSQIPIGSVVEVSCVTPGSTVVSKNSSSVTLSNPSTLTLTASASFFPYGDGDGSTTFGLPDLRGYTIAGRDNMGGVAANRLTSTYFGTNADASGAMGGSQSQVIAQTNLPNVNFAVTGTAAPQIITNQVVEISATGGVLSLLTPDTNVPSTTASIAASSAVTGNAASGGSATAFSIIQPTITINYIIKITPDTILNNGNYVSSVGNYTSDNTLTVTGTSIGSNQYTGTVQLKCTTATVSQIGCSEPDGVSIGINGSGVLSVIGFSGILAVSQGGTGRSTFSSNLPLLGNGTSGIIQGTLAGNTTKFATVSGSIANGDCRSTDSNGNDIDAGGSCIIGPIVPLSKGGTNAALTASNGAGVYSSASGIAFIPYPGVIGQCWLSGLPPGWGSCNSSSPGVASFINADNTLTITGTGSGPYTGNVTAKCTVATISQIGCSEPDGTTITISSGIISATSITLEKNVVNNYTIQTSDNGTAFNTAGASGTVILSLPACSSSPLVYQGFVNAPEILEFLLNGTNTISVGASLSTAGGNIQSNVLGTKVILRCESAGFWSTVENGSWTVN